MKQNLACLTFSTLATFLMTFSMIATAEAASPTRKKEPSRGAYRAELDSLISQNKIACKAATDCDALPLGVRSCGGPSEYIVLSKGTRTKIQSALTELTQMIDQMDREQNSNSGMMGTCEVMEKPEVVCQSGACQKKNG